MIVMIVGIIMRVMKWLGLVNFSVCMVSRLVRFEMGRISEVVLVS